jgi:hypothetical protein
MYTKAPFNQGILTHCSSSHCEQFLKFLRIVSFFFWYECGAYHVIAHTEYFVFLFVSASLNLKWMSRIDEIKIKPLLLSKGTAKVAIYGLGNIRDERLHQVSCCTKNNCSSPVQASAHEVHMKACAVVRQDMRSRLRAPCPCNEGPVILFRF